MAMEPEFDAKHIQEWTGTTWEGFISNPKKFVKEGKVVNDVLVKGNNVPIFSVRNMNSG